MGKMLAPAQKCLPWLPTTSAAHSGFSSSARACSAILKMSSSRALAAGLWNSSSSTRSPRSSRLALAVRIVVADHLHPFTLIEGLGARFQHFHHPGGYRHPLRLHAGDRFAHAQRVPSLKRAQLVHEPPLVGVIDRKDVFGDLRDHAGGIVHAEGGNRP